MMHEQPALLIIEKKKMVVKVNHGLKWTIYDEMVDGSISN
jgi:hypothetical protein